VSGQSPVDHSAAFRPDYNSHRRRFLELCSQRGLQTRTLVHPRTGPAGEPLATDLARIGPRSAKRVLMLVSGTHGVEGFCGSAIQATLLSEIAEPPPETAVVLVHALNPFGFAWLRRTDADNIDLNRNFIDFRRPLPQNHSYAELHEALVPAGWDGPARDSADAFLRSYVTKRGKRALQEAISGGQYWFPDGLFFGGQRSSWSNLRWLEILQEQAEGADLVAVIDIHCGLGAAGACELISGARAGTREFAAASSWFGDSIAFPGRDSTAPAAQGYMGDSLAAALPRAVGALVVAEFGTVEFDRIFAALRADNWVHARSKAGSPEWLAAKRQMFDAFVRPEATWKSAVVEGGLSLIRRTLAALADNEAGDFGASS
jgi:hypothetical protein